MYVPIGPKSWVRIKVLIVFFVIILMSTGFGVPVVGYFPMYTSISSRLSAGKLLVPIYYLVVDYR